MAKADGCPLLGWLAPTLQEDKGKKSSEGCVKVSQLCPPCLLSVPEGAHRSPIRTSTWGPHPSPTPPSLVFPPVKWGIIEPGAMSGVGVGDCVWPLLELSAACE